MKLKIYEPLFEMVNNFYVDVGFFPEPSNPYVRIQVFGNTKKVGRYYIGQPASRVIPISRMPLGPILQKMPVYQLPGFLEEHFPRFSAEELSLEPGVKPNTLVKDLISPAENSESLPKIYQKVKTGGKEDKVYVGMHVCEFVIKKNVLILLREAQ